MKHWLRFSLAVFLVGAIGACSGDSSNGPDFDDTATTAATEVRAENAASLASDVVGRFNFGQPDIYLAASAAFARLAAKHPLAARSPLTARLDRGTFALPGLVAVQGAPIQFSAAPGCTVSSYGSDGDPFDFYDGNDNDLPDDWGVTYVCIAQDDSDLENVITHRTTIEISAKENNAALYGYTSTLVYEEKASDEEGSVSGTRYDVSGALDIRTGSATDRSRYRYRAWETFEGETNEGIDGEDYDGTFDPTDPIVLGDPLPNGQLGFTAKLYHLETGDVSLSFTIDTPTLLAYSAACRASNTVPPFTSGSIRGRLNGNGSSASFMATFSDCALYTVSTEHTTDPVLEDAVQGDR